MDEMLPPNNIEYSAHCNACHNEYLQTEFPECAICNRLFPYCRRHVTTLLRYTFNIDSETTVFCCPVCYEQVYNSDFRDYPRIKKITR